VWLLQHDLISYIFHRFRRRVMNAAALALITVR